jgi:integrase
MVNETSKIKPGGSIRGNYSKLNQPYRSIVDHFMEQRCNEHLSFHSIRRMTAVACSFFAYLQNRAYESLEDVSEEDVINFFIEDGHPRYETSSRYRLSEFLETVADEYPVCLKIKNWLPYIRVTRKNIQYLTDEEVQIIKDVCMDIGLPLSYQIRAVVMILLYTGLRSCDIAALKLSSIDWEKEVIHVVQSKTDVPLTIPMHVHAGNAIYDYITKERKSGSEYLFVTKKNVPFKSVNISRCVSKLFKAAGIRQNKTDRKGTHIFRHHLATKLLENEVAQPVISQTLGHTDPVSVQAYLSADVKHLRQCSLSIEDFPLNWEVFDHA